MEKKPSPEDMNKVVEVKSNVPAPRKKYPEVKINQPFSALAGFKVRKNK